MLILPPVQPSVGHPGRDLCAGGAAGRGPAEERAAGQRAAGRAAHQARHGRQHRTG